MNKTRGRSRHGRRPLSAAHDENALDVNDRVTTAPGPRRPSRATTVTPRRTGRNRTHQCTKVPHRRSTRLSRPVRVLLLGASPSCASLPVPARGSAGAGRVVLASRRPGPRRGGRRGARTCTPVRRLRQGLPRDRTREVVGSPDTCRRCGTRWRRAVVRPRLVVHVRPAAASTAPEDHGPGVSPPSISRRCQIPSRPQPR